jgi:ATP-dependent DNA helicase 2 subunit 2
MDDSYSPLLHRIEQAVRWRAIRPNEPLPPPSNKLTQLSKPPADLQARAKKYLDQIIAAGDVKKGDFSTPIQPNKGTN